MGLMQIATWKNTEHGRIINMAWLIEHLCKYCNFKTWCHCFDVCDNEDITEEPDIHEVYVCPECIHLFECEYNCKVAL